MSYVLYICFHSTITMANFSNHNISVEELLKFIPDELLDKLSKSTDVDHQVKKLFGKNVFYLLLYGFLESTKVSLRGLEDIYSSQKFQFLFNIDSQDGIKYNSLSDRLSALNADYFETIYKYIYTRFTDLYTDEEAVKYSITRVDSTMVAEAANKLEHGMWTSNKYGKKKQIKYTMSMTDIFPSGVEVFTEQAGLNENYTIPTVISKAVNKENIFVFDRGVSKREVFKELNAQQISFVTRITNTKNYKIVSSNKVPERNHKNLEIVDDQIVILRSKYNKPTIPLRLITTTQKDKKKEDILFLTNRTDIQATEIIDIYAKRWDIEVFFRFIKQELNFSHFLSTNKNGIKIVLYVTLILAILILVYKKLNNIGYKTAVRRFRIELDEIIMKMTITFAGGDPSLVFR